MPGPNEPGYNVLHPPKTRAPQAWSNFWNSLLKYDVNRQRKTQAYIRGIRRLK